MGKQKRIVRTAMADRCDSLAEKITTMTPPKEIVYNSLKDLYIDARTEGYLQHIKDSVLFKKTKALKLKEDWDTQKTALDDRIHGRKELINK